MKFCRDCRNYIKSVYPERPGLAKCLKDKKPFNEYAVLGTGEQFDYGWCSTNRIGPSSETNCGEDAAWFQPIYAIQSNEGHTA